MARKEIIAPIVKVEIQTEEERRLLDESAIKYGTIDAGTSINGREFRPFKTNPNTINAGDSRQMFYQDDHGKIHFQY